jgi:hypothetical protein
MPSKLNLFPVRVPIGRTVDSTGRTIDVHMTLEFARALTDLMVRVGGTENFSTDELAALVSADPNDTSALAVLQRKVVDQEIQIAGYERMAARLAVIERNLADMRVLAETSAAPPVDWEHPGKIGAGSSNTGNFSYVTVQKINKLTFTQPLTGAVLTLTDGKTLAALNTLTFSGIDGSTLNIGPGGTLGTAAFTDAITYATRTNSALGPVATDAASTQALANSMRSALLSVGIGT